MIKEIECEIQHSLPNFRFSNLPSYQLLPLHRIPGPVAVPSKEGIVVVVGATIPGPDYLLLDTLSSRETLFSRFLIKTLVVIMKT